MQQEGEQRGEGSSPQHSGNDSGQPRTTGPLASCPDHGPRPRAVCGCPDCAAAMQRHLLSIGASRALLARQGKHVPPLPRDADRYGLGDDCPACQGNGVLDCQDCSGTGGGSDWDGSSACSSCYGSGTGEECERCDSEGVLLLRRCCACGHMSEARDLHPDPRLAALRNWTGGPAWICDGCVPCERCPAFVHADVVSDAGLCEVCERAAASRLRCDDWYAPAAPVAGLLPERCQSFLRDERGLESVEYAVLAGLVVAGLVAVIAAIAVGVMKALRNLRGELDPGR